MKKWKFGVYLRLSADEKGKDNEQSNSVVNQRKIIEYYLNDKKDITIFKCYVDDGYTGTDFNRPGYKEMLNDIETKKINGVIVKDLSRLGRNYIQVGNFIDKIVPSYKLRFISVNDNVDSLNNPRLMDSLEIPFKNLINENYSKDSSIKLRTALSASKKAGNFIGKYAPYGYIKDEKDCHKIIVDPDAAVVVKRIFELVLRGKSKQEIKEELNNNHILTPSIYMRDRIGAEVCNPRTKWTVYMLDAILTNETYIGTLVQGKRTRLNHKAHNFVRVAEGEWVVFKNHHDAIIREDIFYQVQNILYNRNVKANKNGSYHTYSGFLKCSDCGKSLYRITRTKRGKLQAFYYCSTYLKTKQCSKHHITERKLDNIVLNAINQYIELICDIDKHIDEIVSYSRIDYNEEVKKIKIIEINKQISQYENLLSDLIKDYQNDIISQEDFEEFKNDYLYETNKLKKKKEKIESSKFTQNNLDWIKKFKHQKKFTDINRSIINEFIDNIYVGDKDEVEISFLYKDQYEDALKYLKSKNNMV